MLSDVYHCTTEFPLSCSAQMYMSDILLLLCSVHETWVGWNVGKRDTAINGTIGKVGKSGTSRKARENGTGERTGKASCLT